MSHLWEIVERYQREHGPSVSEIARRMGTGPQSLFNWRDRPIKRLPTEHTLRALSDVTRTHYVEVVVAALIDAGYGSEREFGSLSPMQPGRLIEAEAMDFPQSPEERHEQPRTAGRRDGSQKG